MDQSTLYLDDHMEKNQLGTWALLYPQIILQMGENRKKIFFRAHVAPNGTLNLPLVKLKREYFSFTMWT